MDNKIVYITVQVGEQNVYRTFTTDYVKFTDAGTLGEMVQDMFDTLQNADGKVFNETQV
jgi:hypothetical protein